jgi:hypothetical protein
MGGEGGFAWEFGLLLRLVLEGLARERMLPPPARDSLPQLLDQSLQKLPRRSGRTWRGRCSGRMASGRASEAPWRLDRSAPASQPELGGPQSHAFSGRLLSHLWNPAAEAGADNAGERNHRQHRDDPPTQRRS